MTKLDTHLYRVTIYSEHYFVEQAAAVGNFMTPKGLLDAIDSEDVSAYYIYVGNS